MCDDAGSDSTLGSCYAYVQTPAAGEQAADWDPRLCISDSEIVADSPKIIASQTVTFGVEGVDDMNVYDEDIEACVRPEPVVEEEEDDEEPEEEEEEEEEGAFTAAFALATLAAATAYMA